MFKKSSIRRIMLASTALLITGIIYVFPEKNDEFPQTINYQSENLSPIYLIDFNNYVSRTEIMLDEEDTILKAKEVIEALTIGSKKSNYIKDNFNSIIPSDTKLLDITLEGALLKINFSSEFLNVSLDEEVKMIESLIFSLTEDENINSVMIFIEDEKLTHYPNSEKLLPNELTRNIGINKVYDIDTFTNTTQTTTYYIGKSDNDIYYIPITTVSNDHSEKVEVIINNLRSSPIYNKNVMSYLVSSVELLDYEINENIASLNFNNNILYDFSDDKIIEEVKYTISLSLKDSLNIQEVIFSINDKKIENIKF